VLFDGGRGMEGEDRRSGDLLTDVLRLTHISFVKA